MAIGCLSMGSLLTTASANNLHIIPENTEWGDANAAKEKAKEYVKYIADPKKGGTVLDRYEEKVKEIEKSGNVGMAFSTGVMGWKTLIQYVVLIVKFLSQLGLLIGGLMVVYAWYLYATTIFGTWDPSKAKSAIKNAITWVIVVIASYAIWRGLISFFL